MIACEMGPRTVLSRSLKAGFTRRQGQAAVSFHRRQQQGQLHCAGKVSCAAGVSMIFARLWSTRSSPNAAARDPLR